MSREHKLDRLWRQLTEVSPKKPKCQNFGEMWKHFGIQQSFTSFFAKGDEIDDERLKLVHQQGIVATGRFDVKEDVVSAKGYTGIFASGSDSMILRLSETGLHVDGITTSVNPSLAFKMLRNGVESANQFGMISFEPDPKEGEEWNWFAKDLTNHLPNYKQSQELSNTCQTNDVTGEIDRTQVYAEECAPLTSGRWNSFLNGFPFANGSLQLAKYDQDGNEATVPKYPFRLKFVAREDVISTDGSERFYKQMVEGGSAQIDKDIVLYHVFATDVAEGNNWVEIGEIVPTSYFTPSLWGDEKLFFKHGTLQDDLSFAPQGWVEDSGFLDGDIKTEYQFNREKYGGWNDPSFFQSQISKATEEDVINGMSQGCPFAFLIDQINKVGPRRTSFVTPSFSLGLF